MSDQMDSWGDPSTELWLPQNPSAISSDPHSRNISSAFQSSEPGSGDGITSSSSGTAPRIIIQKNSEAEERTARVSFYGVESVEAAETAQIAAKVAEERMEQAQRESAASQRSQDYDERSRQLLSRMALGASIETSKLPKKSSKFAKMSKSVDTLTTRAADESVLAAATTTTSSSAISGKSAEMDDDSLLIDESMPITTEGPSDAFPTDNTSQQSMMTATPAVLQGMLTETLSGDADLASGLASFPSASKSWATLNEEATSSDEDDHDYGGSTVTSPSHSQMPEPDGAKLILDATLKANRRSGGGGSGSKSSRRGQSKFGDARKKIASRKDDRKSSSYKVKGKGGRGSRNSVGSGSGSSRKSGSKADSVVYDGDPNDDSYYDESFTNDSRASSNGLLTHLEYDDSVGDTPDEFDEESQPSQYTGKSASISRADESLYDERSSLGAEEDDDYADTMIDDDDLMVSGESGSRGYHQSAGGARRGSGKSTLVYKKKIRKEDNSEESKSKSTGDVTTTSSLHSSSSHQASVSGGSSRLRRRGSESSSARSSAAAASESSHGRHKRRKSHRDERSSYGGSSKSGGRRSRGESDTYDDYDRDYPSGRGRGRGRGRSGGSGSGSSNSSRRKSRGRGRSRGYPGPRRGYVGGPPDIPPRRIAESAADHGHSITTKRGVTIETTRPDDSKHSRFPSRDDGKDNGRYRGRGSKRRSRGSKGRGGNRGSEKRGRGRGRGRGSSSYSYTPRSQRI